jgi:two-component system, NarL family, nitrate/nitrite response regulator NarL
VIRAALVIDIPFYREGLAALLSQSADVTVVGSPAGDEEVAALVTRESPDVVLLDIGAAGAHETLATLRVLATPPRIVALALSETPESIAEWAGAGVMGYISRSAGLADVLQCLRCVVRGEAYCSPRVMAILLHRFAALEGRLPLAPARSAGLTAREHEILDLVGRGLSNKVIAARLHISHATAKNHVHHILDKLQLRSRAEVAAYLHTQGKGRGAAEVPPRSA